MWSADISPKSRRGILRRAVFSEEQRKELERTFRRQKYISKTDRNKLAADLSLKESQVIENKIPACLTVCQYVKDIKQKNICVDFLCVYPPLSTATLDEPEICNIDQGVAKLSMLLSMYNISMFTV